jgi:hypothetical protein
MQIPFTHNDDQEDIEYLKSLVRPRTFGLWRHIDHTGISGLGFVTTGVQFSDGFIVMRWRNTEMPSLGLYTDIKHVEGIHGHNGESEVIWLDE